MNNEGTLAYRVRAWRTQRRLTVAIAAKALGMSKRTLEGIEQGRGFGYPKLLLVAMEEIGRTEFNFFDQRLMPDEPAADPRAGGKGTGDRRGHAGGNPKGRRTPVHQHRPRKEARDATLRSGRSAGLEGKE